MSEDESERSGLEDGDDSERSPSLVASEGGGEARWRASVPPEESWGDIDPKTQWGFDVIGEQVDEEGNLLFEVRWEDWARKDGTKTTWTAETGCCQWPKAQQERRQIVADESSTIKVVTTTDILNTPTYLQSEAYTEKLRRSRIERRSNRMLELAEVLSSHQERLQVDSQGPFLSNSSRKNQRASTRQKTEVSRANSKLSVTSSATRASPTVSSSAFTPGPASTRSPTLVDRLPPQQLNKGKGKRRMSLSEDERSDSLAVSSPSTNSPRVQPFVLLTPHNKRPRITSESEDELGTSPTRPSPPVSPQSTYRKRGPRPSSPLLNPQKQRRNLQTEWSNIAKQNNAAPLSFTNVVDDQAIPDVPQNFRYLESEYCFAPDVPNPSQMEDFLVRCSSKRCKNVAACECQEAASSLRDEHGSLISAYTPTGLFAFNVPSGIEVVECNKLCKCTLATCNFRVSQRPRKFPIDIFKTESRGWGVRSMVEVKRGAVLGLHTGLVVRRDQAHSHPLHKDSDYVFDLDGDENKGNNGSTPPPHDLYSVNSQSHGNWTRFINHSCSPNLQVYLVVHDTPPANGLPFIVFVANTDIPAETELTVDYNPHAGGKDAQKQGLKSKAKGKKTKPRSIPCHCGAEICRGYL